MTKNLQSQIRTTYVYFDAFMVIEYGDFWVVWRYESVEFFLVVIPLDGIEVVSLHVIVASEHRLVAFERVRRDHRVFQQPYAMTHWKDKKQNVF